MGKGTKNRHQVSRSGLNIHSEMLDYCVQDTQVTLKLFELLQRRMQDYA